MLKIKNILFIGLISCFLLVGCGQKQEQSEVTETQAKQEISQIKDTITTQANEIVTKGSEVIEKAKSESRLMEERTAATVKELIAKANSFIEQGN